MREIADAGYRYMNTHTCLGTPFSTTCDQRKREREREKRDKRERETETEREGESLSDIL